MSRVGKLRRLLPWLLLAAILVSMMALGGAAPQPVVAADYPVSQFPWTSGCKWWTVGLHGNSTNYCSDAAWNNIYALDFSDPSVPNFTVVAPADGKIAFKGDTGRGNCCGNAVEIDHGNGFKTRYCHLQSVDPRLPGVNSSIKRGTPLGKAGTSGTDASGKSCSTGAHLHWEIYRWNGTGWSLDNWDDKIVGNWRFHLVHRDSNVGPLLYGQGTATREGQPFWGSMATTLTTKAPNGDAAGCPIGGSGKRIYVWTGSPANTKNSFMDYFTDNGIVCSAYNGASAHRFCDASGG
jgi:murein DD-endopeptidase MepM/ murein hydrolase activator NlpD